MHSLFWRLLLVDVNSCGLSQIQCFLLTPLLSSIVIILISSPQLFEWGFYAQVATGQVIAVWIFNNASGFDNAVVQHFWVQNLFGVLVLRRSDFCRLDLVVWVNHFDQGLVLIFVCRLDVAISRRLERVHGAHGERHAISTGLKFGLERVLFWPFITSGLVMNPEALQSELGLCTHHIINQLWTLSRWIGLFCSRDLGLLPSFFFDVVVVLDYLGLIRFSLPKLTIHGCFLILCLYALVILFLVEIFQFIFARH